MMNSMTNVHQMKKDICEIGRRIYNKGFAAANDGNISIRYSEDRILCTPTLHNKGFLTPEDIATVDMDGKQVAGRKPVSSEVKLHIEVFQERSEIKSCVHCHPPHATAFSIAGEPIPTCVMPEVEIFLGEVPIARYETPGDKAFAETILPFVKKCNIMVLSNHGTVSFGESVERAYWWTEILDAYCRMLILAKTLGNVNYFSEEKERELLALKGKWGYSDPRNEKEFENCDICANDVFRSSWAEAGVDRRAFKAAPPMGPQAQAPAGDQEALIQTITERVIEALASK